MGETSRIVWTEELIASSILDIVKSLGLDRMPSRSECVFQRQDESLANAITRNGGWYAWADKLGLEVKKSETLLGKTAEKSAAEMLKTIGFEVRQMSQNFPYDLLVNDCIKVDVKASHVYHGKNGDFYSFNLEKSFATCDFYILFCLGEGSDIVKTMVVPSACVIANNQISVGIKNSKYNKFIDRWDLIEAACTFWQELAM